MSVELEYEGDVAVLKVDGDLAGDNAERLRILTQQALQQGSVDFHIDLTGASGCNSCGLEVLTWLQRECHERLGLVSLVETSRTFEKILELTRLRERFQLDVSQRRMARNDHD